MDSKKESDDVINAIKEKLKIGVVISSNKQNIIHIKRCLDSIEKQTRKPDFVVISLSGTSEVPTIDLYSFNVKIFSSIESDSANKNRAVNFFDIKPDIVCFFDCIDEMYPERLEYIEKVFIKSSSDLVLHNYNQIDNPNEDTNRDTRDFKYHNYELELYDEDCIFVALPTYNRGIKCSKVIDMILSQNIHNWYLVVIDDGSENIHSEIITSFISKINDSRISYHKNITNLKLPSTLNVGVDKFLEGKCNYFTWISDDNIYYPNYLKNLHDLKADFAHSAWNTEKNEGIYYTIQTEYKNYESIRTNFRGLASYMWSRYAIQKIGKYNTYYELVQDLEYLYRTFYYLDPINIKYSSKSEMVYILHSDAGTIKHKPKLSIEDRHLKENFDTYIVQEFQKELFKSNIVDRSICHGNLSVRYNVWLEENFIKEKEDTGYIKRLLSKGYVASYIHTKLSIYHNYKFLEYLLTETMKYRTSGNHRSAYINANEGIKISTTLNDKEMLDNFYNELSVVSYYEKDIVNGLYSCDRVMLSNILTPNIIKQAIENVKFYLSPLPIKYRKDISLNLEPEFKCSSLAIIKNKNNYVCLLKAVNYTIDNNGNYAIRDPTGISVSKNYLFTLDVDKDVNNQNIKYTELINNSKNEKFPSRIESCRIFQHKNKLCFFGKSLDQINLSQICYGEINNREITKIIPLEYGDNLKCENDWLPFVVNDDILFIYSWDPFILCSLDSVTGLITTKINKKISQYNLTGFKGSASPIPYKDGFLCTIHYVTQQPFKYYHRFIFLYQDYEAIKISKGFYFIQPDIEYNTSIAISDDGLLVTSSYLDNSSTINVIDYNIVDEYLNYL